MHFKILKQIKYQSTSLSFTIQELLDEELIRSVVMSSRICINDKYDLILRGIKIVTLDTGIIMQSAVIPDQRFSSGGLCTTL